MKNQLNDLLDKEMDRTTFLQHMGIGLLALTGFSAVFKALNGYGSNQSVRAGFGSGSYGGSREQTR